MGLQGPSHWCCPPVGAVRRGNRSGSGSIYTSDTAGGFLGEAVSRALEGSRLSGERVWVGGGLWASCSDWSGPAAGGWTSRGSFRLAYARPKQKCQS
eukprot:31415-Pyramimonas_sp.AAC.1